MFKAFFKQETAAIVNWITRVNIDLYHDQAQQLFIRSQTSYNL